MKTNMTEIIMRHLPGYLLTGLVVLILDGMFIYVTKDEFNAQIKMVQGMDIKPDILAVILSYIVIISGLYYFIIREKRSVMEAGLFGFSMYAVYELTTKSLLKSWHWKTVIMDTLWGATLFALTTAIITNQLSFR